jgi:hypothetical protein
MESVHPSFLKRSPMVFSNKELRIIFTPTLTLPHQGGGIFNVNLYEEGDEMENDIGIDSCHPII